MKIPLLDDFGNEQRDENGEVQLVEAPTYELAISGYVIVRVQAKDEDDAMEKALEDTVAGELYNYELDAIELIEEKTA